MANKFYQPGAERAVKVQDLFSAIAPRYDFINDLQSFGLHRLWKRRLIRLSGASAGQRVLDLCCGTGDVAFGFSKARARVVGLDFSAPMLERARERAHGSGATAWFVRGDALRLPFGDDQFDVTTISYGLRNLVNFEAGLREMLRVTRPGGRLAVLDFGKPPGRLLRAAYFGYLRFVVPLFGRAFCGDPAAYAYILESLHHYPAQEGIEVLMRKLQCSRVRVVNLLGGVMSINYGDKS